MREGSNCCRTKYHNQSGAADVLWSSGWNDRTRLVHPTQSPRPRYRRTVRKHYTRPEQNLTTVYTACTVCAYIIHSVSLTCQPKMCPGRYVWYRYAYTKSSCAYIYIYIQTTHTYTKVCAYTSMIYISEA